MTIPQQTGVVPTASQPQRDPQSFTRGDVLAWKTVAYAAGAVTVVGTAAAIIAVVAVTNG